MTTPTFAAHVTTFATAVLYCILMIFCELYSNVREPFTVQQPPPTHQGNLSASSSSSNIVHTSQATAVAVGGGSTSSSSGNRHHRKNVISCVTVGDSDNEEQQARSPTETKVVQHTSQQNTPGESRLVRPAPFPLILISWPLFPPNSC